MKGFFGDFFDLDHDGKLDLFERAMDSVTFMSLVEESEDAGIDVEDLEYMDDDERREALEEAGLDPEDFDWL